MSATLAPAPRTLPAALPQLPARVEEAAPAQDAAAAEVNRWLVGLGTPFAFSAIFFALSVGTSAHWLLGPGLVLGPVLFIFMTLYLCISSDSNGEPPAA